MQILNIIKNFFWYFTSSVVVKSTNLILMPLILVKLSQAEFGLLSLVQNFIAIFSIFLGLGLKQFVSIEFFHLNISARKELIARVVGIYVLCAIPVLILLFSGWRMINTFFFGGAADIFLIFIVLLTISIQFFNELLIQTLRFIEKVFLLVSIQLSSAALILMLKLFSLLVLNGGVTGLVFANFIGLSGITLYGAYLFYKKISFNTLMRSIDVLPEYLKKSMPFVPYALFAMLISYADRWFLMYYGSLEMVGVYSFADMFSQLYQLTILFPLIGAYYPHVMRSYLSGKNIIIEEKKHRWVMIIILLLLLIGLCTAYFLGARLLRYFIPVSYSHAIIYIFPLLVGQILLTGVYFAQCFLQFKKRTMAMLALMTSALGINVILNALLIPRFQIEGAIVATVITYLVYFGATLWYANNLIKKVI